MKISKSALSVFLSKLKRFESGKVRLEQYSTEPDIAASILHTALMDGNIDGKHIADLGAGSGILGIGALILGAQSVHFVESEDEALKLLDSNLHWLKSEYVDLDLDGKIHITDGDIATFATPVDTVIMNPPFGTQQKHHDKVFLEKAFLLAEHVYSMHKSTTTVFLKAIASDFSKQFVALEVVKFPLRKTMAHHRAEKKEIKVVLCRFSSKDKN